MGTVYILDVTDAAANVEVRAGFGVLDTTTGTGASIIASASVIAELHDTESKRPVSGERRAWRQMRGLAAGAVDPAIANVVMQAYPSAAARKQGKLHSGIDRAFLTRIGRDIESHLHGGVARTLTIMDAGRERTLAFVPARAMVKLAQIEGAQDVPASVKRALPKLLAA